MCGIAGVAVAAGRHRDGLPLAAGGRITPVEVADRMLRAVRHRGPDGHGIERVSGPPAPDVVLAHARLAILDPSVAGRQPMRDPTTGDWVVTNGEVYNFRELRGELDAAGGRRAWTSETDTEVLLAEYGRSSLGCLGRLRAMFAFALWDAARRRLVLARDRLGVKPLYWHAGDGFVLFASELRALLASGLVARCLDARGLEDFLTYQCVPAPRTLVRGVSLLPPASWLAVDAEGLVTEGRYWDLLRNASEDARDVTSEAARHRVRALLEDAVASHLVSDVPVGVLLSGGIDSSAIAALVRAAGRTPRTFCLAFAEREFDEAEHARAVADRVGADHAEIRLTEAAVLDQLHGALAAMDHATGDGVNTYLVARAVRAAGVTVALSGLGGDELFGGYPSFRRAALAAPWLAGWRRAPGPLRRLAAGLAESVEGRSVALARAAAVARGDGTLATLLPATRQLLSRAQRRALIAAPWRAAAADADDAYVPALREALAGAPWAGPFTQATIAELRAYTQDLLLRDTDQMSMCHPVEIRVPLLDHRLVEYVVGLPDHVKAPRGLPKRLLVESLGPLLPDAVARRAKRGFLLPFDPWMRGALRGFCEERLGAERVRARGLFRPEAVRALWMRFLERRPGASWSRLWALAVLEDWLERTGLVTGAGP